MHFMGERKTNVHFNEECLGSKPEVLVQASWSTSMAEQPRNSYFYRVYSSHSIFGFLVILSYVEISHCRF